MSPTAVRAPAVIDLDATARAWIGRLPPVSHRHRALAALGVALVVPLLAGAYRNAVLDALDAALLVAGLTVVAVICRGLGQVLARHHVGAWQQAVHPHGPVCEELTEAVAGTLSDHGMILLRLKAIHPLSGPTRVLAAGADGRQVYYRFVLDPGADPRLHRQDWDVV